MVLFVFIRITLNSCISTPAINIWKMPIFLDIEKYFGSNLYQRYAILAKQHWELLWLWVGEEILVKIVGYNHHILQFTIAGSHNKRWKRDGFKALIQDQNQEKEFWKWFTTSPPQTKVQCLIATFLSYYVPVFTASAPLMLQKNIVWDYAHHSVYNISR